MIVLAAETLNLAHAIALGLVEGLTEFLPVSSTGHLLVAQRMMGLTTEAATNRALDAYAICIQAGAILAVTALYPRRVLAAAVGIVRPGEGRRLLVALITAFVPAAMIGVAAGDAIQDRLFSVGPVAVAWLVGGVALLGFSRTRFATGGLRRLEELSTRDATLIGMAQVAALWPGVSRSLVTILAALVLGYSMSAAVEFSFLLGLVTLSAATGFAALTEGHLIVSNFGIAVPMVGLAVAFVSAIAAVRWMVAFLNRRGLTSFGWYRVAIALITFAAIA